MTITVTTGGPIGPGTATPGTYDWLFDAVSDWMARSDLSGSAAEFIRLGELGLNRELRGGELDTILTGVVSSDQIDISNLNAVTPVALFLRETGCSERELLPRSEGTFEYTDSTGCPCIWAIDQRAIQFDRPLDQAYPFRFRYRERFELSDTVQTNWLIREHADLYLAASLVWGSLYIQDATKLGTWPTVLAAGLKSVKHTIAQNRRGELTLDPALTRTTRGIRITTGGPFY